jgi:carboxylesterase type B
MLDFLTDVLFAAPAKAVLDALPGEAFTYLWARQNPISKDLFPGIATHCTDMIYSTALYMDELSEEDRELSLWMAERWIGFASGMDPWKSRQSEGYDLIITDSGAREEIYWKSNHRRVEAENIIAKDMLKYGTLIREFVEN